jgi:hypothetical protein
MWFHVPADAMRTATRDTFYTFDSVGYNDYPFVNELARFLEEPQATCLNASAF